MKPDFFKNLPPEIITEIFLRLPAVSILISKCVCKRWIHLLESDAFVKSHFARSAPALVVLGDSGGLKVLEFEGELDLELESHDPLIKYDFPYRQAKVSSSVNGLIALRVGVNMICVCNPITREVIKLDLPSSSRVSGFGFGARKISGRYKAVSIRSKPYGFDDKLDCHVYTLGTGSWRRLEGNPFVHQYGEGAFLNGNFHWIAYMNGERSLISCFDLETECFSFFKAPPYLAHEFFRRGTTLSVLSGCLWFCKVTSDYEDEDDGWRCEVSIWIMKEYGVDESWSMEYVIPLDDGMRLYYPCIRYVEPIKVLENGDLLMLVTIDISRRLFYYSNKTKTMRSIDLFGAGETSDDVKYGLFTPTLVSLKTLGLGVENVISF